EDHRVSGPAGRARRDRDDGDGDHLRERGWRRMTAVTRGETRELVLVRGLTRTQIGQYAGASGDFNPVHTDERFAVEAAGYPSVFAHGMLTMGMAARVLTDWF